MNINPPLGTRWYPLNHPAADEADSFWELEPEHKVRFYFNGEPTASRFSLVQVLTAQALGRVVQVAP